MGGRLAAAARSPLVPPLAVVAALLTSVLLSLLVSPVLAIPGLLVPSVLVASQRWRRDPVTALCIYGGLLFAVPSGLVVGPLGAAGRPAALFGLACLGWWVLAKWLPDEGIARGLQPVRVVAIMLTAAIVASYAAAFARPIDTLESSSADRAVLATLGLVGVLLLAADGVLTRGRLDTLLRRIVGMGAVLAGLGILQFVGLDVSPVFRLPLLTELTSFQEVQMRGGQRRIAATAAHPIEYGVVLALLFPLAVHYALHAARSRLAAWAAVVLLAAAIPMSVSRSGTLAFAITFIVLWLSWPRHLRVRSAQYAVGFAFVMRFAVPGLLGTIKSLFTNIQNDESTTGRTDDYSAVGGFIADAPFFGRGFGTFIPSRYFWLDNQYLGMLVETGVVGALAFLMLFVVGFATARGARRGTDAETRSLGQALAASLLASAVAAGTFDMLAFGMASGVTFLIVGSAGALWRITRRSADGTVQRIVRDHSDQPGARASSVPA